MNPPPSTPDRASAPTEAALLAAIEAPGELPDETPPGPMRLPAVQGSKPKPSSASASPSTVASRKRRGIPFHPGVHQHMDSGRKQVAPVKLFAAPLAGRGDTPDSDVSAISMLSTGAQARMVHSLRTADDRMSPGNLPQLRQGDPTPSPKPVKLEAFQRPVTSPVVRSGSPTLRTASRRRSPSPTRVPPPSEHGMATPSTDVSFLLRDNPGQSSQIPDSIVPDDDHIFEVSGIPPPGSDPASFKHQDGSWYARVFPAKVPSGRQQAVLLSEWMDNKLARILGEAGDDGLSANSAEVQEIFSITFNELIRQVSVQCVERGVLMAKIWRLHSDVVDRLVTFVNESRENESQYKAQIAELQEQRAAQDREIQSLEFQLQGMMRETEKLRQDSSSRYKQLLVEKYDALESVKRLESEVDHLTKVSEDRKAVVVEADPTFEMEALQDNLRTRDLELEWLQKERERETGRFVKKLYRLETEVAHLRELETQLQALIDADKEIRKPTVTPDLPGPSDASTYDIRPSIEMLLRNLVRRRKETLLTNAAEIADNKSASGGRPMSARSSLSQSLSVFEADKMTEVLSEAMSELDHLEGTEHTSLANVALDQALLDEVQASRETYLLSKYVARWRHIIHEIKMGRYVPLRNSGIQTEPNRRNVTTQFAYQPMRFNHFVQATVFSLPVSCQTEDPDPSDLGDDDVPLKAAIGTVGSSVAGTDPARTDNSLPVIQGEDGAPDSGRASGLRRTRRRTAARGKGGRQAEAVTPYKGLPKLKRGNTKQVMSATQQQPLRSGDSVVETVVRSAEEIEVISQVTQTDFSYNAMRGRVLEPMIRRRHIGVDAQVSSDTRGTQAAVQRHTVALQFHATMRDAVIQAHPQIRRRHQKVQTLAAKDLPQDRPARKFAKRVRSSMKARSKLKRSTSRKEVPSIEERSIDQLSDAEELGASLRSQHLDVDTLSDRAESESGLSMVSEVPSDAPGQLTDRSGKTLEPSRGLKPLLESEVALVNIPETGHDFAEADLHEIQEALRAGTYIYLRPPVAESSMSELLPDPLGPFSVGLVPQAVEETSKASFSISFVPASEHAYHQAKSMVFSGLEKVVQDVVRSDKDPGAYFDLVPMATQTSRPGSGKTMAMQTDVPYPDHLLTAPVEYLEDELMIPSAEDFEMTAAELFGAQIDADPDDEQVRLRDFGIEQVGVMDDGDEPETTASRAQSTAQTAETSHDGDEPKTTASRAQSTAQSAETSHDGRDIEPAQLESIKEVAAQEIPVLQPGQFVQPGQVFQVAEAGQVVQFVSYLADAPVSQPAAESTRLGESGGLADLSDVASSVGNYTSIKVPSYIQETIGSGATRSAAGEVPAAPVQAEPPAVTAVQTADVAEASQTALPAVSEAALSEPGDAGEAPVKADGSDTGAVVHSAKVVAVSHGDEGKGFQLLQPKPGHVIQVVEMVEEFELDVDDESEATDGDSLRAPGAVITPDDAEEDGGQGDEGVGAGSDGAEAKVASVGTVGEKVADDVEDNRTDARSDKVDKVDGDEADGDKVGGDEVDGDKVNGDKADGDKPDAEKPDAEKPDADKPEAKPATDKPDADKPADQTADQDAAKVGPSNEPAFSVLVNGEAPPRTPEKSERPRGSTQSAPALPTITTTEPGATSSRSVSGRKRMVTRVIQVIDPESNEVLQTLRPTKGQVIRVVVPGKDGDEEDTVVATLEPKKDTPIQVVQPSVGQHVHVVAPSVDNPTLAQVVHVLRPGELVEAEANQTVQVIRPTGSSRGPSLAASHASLLSAGSSAFSRPTGDADGGKSSQSSQHQLPVAIPHEVSSLRSPVSASPPTSAKSDRSPSTTLRSGSHIDRTTEGGGDDAKPRPPSSRGMPATEDASSGTAQNTTAPTPRTLGRGMSSTGLVDGPKVPGLKRIDSMSKGQFDAVMDAMQAKMSPRNLSPRSATSSIATPRTARETFGGAAAPLGESDLQIFVALPDGKLKPVRIAQELQNMPPNARIVVRSRRANPIPRFGSLQRKSSALQMSMGSMPAHIENMMQGTTPQLSASPSAASLPRHEDPLAALVEQQREQQQQQQHSQPQSQRGSVRASSAASSAVAMGTGDDGERPSLSKMPSMGSFTRMDPPAAFKRSVGVLVDLMPQQPQPQLQSPAGPVRVMSISALPAQTESVAVGSDTPIDAERVLEPSARVVEEKRDTLGDLGMIPERGESPSLPHQESKTLASRGTMMKVLQFSQDVQTEGAPEFDDKTVQTDLTFKDLIQMVYKMLAIDEQFALNLSRAVTDTVDTSAKAAAGVAMPGSPHGGGGAIQADDRLLLQYLSMLNRKTVVEREKKQKRDELELMQQELVMDSHAAAQRSTFKVAAPVPVGEEIEIKSGYEFISQPLVLHQRPTPLKQRQQRHKERTRAGLGNDPTTTQAAMLASQAFEEEEHKRAHTPGSVSSGAGTPSRTLLRSRQRERPVRRPVSTQQKLTQLDFSKLARPRLLSEVALRKFVMHVYLDRIHAHQTDVKTADVTVSQFVYDWLFNKYGLKMLAMQHLYGIVSSLPRYPGDLLIATFSRFCGFGKRPLPLAAFNFFIDSFRFVQSSSVGPSFAPNYRGTTFVALARAVYATRHLLGEDDRDMLSDLYQRLLEETEHDETSGPCVDLFFFLILVTETWVQRNPDKIRLFEAEVGGGGLDGVNPPPASPHVPERHVRAVPQEPDDERFEVDVPRRSVRFSVGE